MGRKWMGALVVALALAAVAGCVTKSSHTEGDREVNDQTMKAGAVVVSAAAAVAEAIDGGDSVKAKTLLQQGAIAGAEIIKNAKQQEGVHGSPAAPQPEFSPAASDAARKKSDDDHASGKWVGPTLGVIGFVLGLASMAAGMPYLAPIFPALAGKVATWAKAGTEIINVVRAKAEANGGSIDVKTVLEIAKDKNVSAGIEDLVTRHAHAHQEAAGHNLTSLDEMKTADDEPSPGSAPAQAPVAVSAP